MKKIVNAVTSFKKLLKAIEPLVKNFPELLKTKRLPDSSLNATEMWGNWLLCAVLRKNISGEITFADDGEGDGIILDRRTGAGRQTEHVCALDNPNSGKILPWGEQRIIDAINLKINKQYSDAEELVLVVFFDGAREWHRDKVRAAINGRSKFKGVYLIGLHTLDEKGWTYSVTELHENHSITYLVRINPDFTHWSVWKWEDSPIPN